MIRMIITIAGNAGSGKSTVAKELARRLRYKRYSTGDFMREMAAKRGVDILQLNVIAENDDTIDRTIDSWAKKLGKTEDQFVIDSRLAFHFIPHSFKVFLTADLPARAKRIFQDKRTTEQHTTLTALKKFMKEREASELKRYMKLYSVDYYDVKNYDLVIDTTQKSVSKAVEMILARVRKKGFNNKK